MMVIKHASKRSANPIDKQVGIRVSMRRKILNMSQGQLGDMLGIRFRQIQKYENGMNRISAGRLERIANILQVPISFFFEGVPAVPDGEAMPAYIYEFVSSNDGLRLIQAFTRIKSAQLRHRIVALVREIAGDDDD